MNKVHYSYCPVCNSAEIKWVQTVKDYSVSKEDFQIWECGSCSLRFTQDIPDETSIAPYYQSSDYISHSNTSKGLINKIYQKVRHYTLGKKADLVISFTQKQGMLLDLGAGIGAFLHTMKNKGWQTRGIEPDGGARNQAKQLFGLELEDARAIDQLPENSFDAITLWHVLEHVHQLHHYIDRLKLLLVKEGKIFIAVPNYSALDQSIYRDHWAAYDVPRHLYHFTPKSMKVLVGQHGMKIMDKKPMWFDSFYISLLSDRYKNGKTNWLRAGFSGLRSNFNALGNVDRCSSVIYIIGAA